MISTLILIAASLASSATAGQVQFLGVAIAGGDFGCQIDGTCPLGSTQLPLGSSGGGGDGPGQMKHWTSLSKPLNLFRLPVSWQFLANNQIGGTLDPTNLAKYDKLVQSCLQTGAHCMIDIHNFARVDNAIIGQGGPTDDQFVSLWTQLATKYAAEDRMVFELMNEPHDLDINLWAATCQKVVTGIRTAGAATQMILLPGTNFDSAATLVSSGSAAALMNITNPDGTTDNLLLDIHKYLDENNSGTHTTCTTNNIDAFTTVAQFLKQSGRKGLISETGASSDSTCITNFCAQNSFINQNSDVFLGLVGWGAGSFDTSYILSLTPSKKNNQLVDNALMQQCMLDIWKDSISSATPTTTKSPVVSSLPIISPAPTTTPIVPTATLIAPVAVTVPPSTVFTTPSATKTTAPGGAGGPSQASVGELIQTLDWSTIMAELGIGASQDPLEVASTPSDAQLSPMTQTPSVNSTRAVTDTLYKATDRPKLTSAASAGATSVVEAGGSRAVDRVSRAILVVAAGMTASLFGLS